MLLETINHAIIIMLSDGSGYLPTCDSREEASVCVNAQNAVQGMISSSCKFVYEFC